MMKIRSFFTLFRPLNFQYEELVVDVIHVLLHDHEKVVVDGVEQEVAVETAVELAAKIFG